MCCTTTDISTQEQSIWEEIDNEGNDGKIPQFTVAPALFSRLEKMESLCEFCKHGKDVEDVCGKLHVEKIDDSKIIAAHHRCMQYSASLVQYKFDHFGGFKIGKVEEEIKRGKRLNCAICKNMKDKKKRYGSATAGCAVATCRKTFHYYCAKRDPIAITKRMIIRFRKEEQDVVLYRVFCSLEHEHQFRSNKSALQQTRKRGDDESDVSDENSDESSKGKTESEKEDQQNSDGEDEWKLWSQSDSQPKNQILPLPSQCSTEQEFQLPDLMLKNVCSSKISNADKDNQGPEVDGADIMINSICSETEENLSDNDDGFDANLVLQASQNHVSEDSDGTVEKHQTNEIDTGKKIAKSGKKSTENGDGKVQEKTVTTSTPDKNKISVALCKLNIGSNDTVNANSRDDSPRRSLKLKPRNVMATKCVGSKSQTITITADINPTKAEPVLSPDEAAQKEPYEDCALILASQQNPPVRKRELLKAAACQELNVGRAAFWCDQVNDLETTDKEMTYLVEYVAQLARKKDYRKLMECILGGAALKEILENVNIISEYHRVVDEETVSKIHQSVQTYLLDALNIKTKNNPANFVMDKDNSALYIRLGPDIDPQEEIRSKYISHKEVELHRWAPGTVLESTCACTDEEGKSIVKWLLLETSYKFSLFEKPEDSDVRLNDVNNPCLSHLRKSCIQSSEESTELSEIANVLWVASVNSDLVKVWPYVKNCIKKFSTTNDNFYAVINVSCYTDFKVSLSDIESIGTESCTIAAYTIKNPTANPVSLIVVKITDTKCPCTPSSSGQGQEELEEIVPAPIQNLGKRRRSMRNMEQPSPKKLKEK